MYFCICIVSILLCAANGVINDDDSNSARLLRSGIVSKRLNIILSSAYGSFDNIEAHKFIDFIKETRFYKQL